MLSVETFATITEAATHMGGDARFLGGGTLLMRDVNYGAAGFSRIVRTTSVDRTITSASNGIRIGAGATMSDVIASPETTALAAAARAVGGPAIRNMATVGGNLFAPHPYGDFATALLALDATVEWSDGRSEPIETTLSQRGSSNGIVASVTVPRISNREFRFRKVTRTKPKGVSVMSIAVRLPGTGGQARIAFGAMGPNPLRAKQAEAALQSAQLTSEGIKPVTDACLQGLAPMDDALSSAWYRTEVAPIHLARTLLEQGGY